jgi:hypothetical protein
MGTCAQAEEDAAWVVREDARLAKEAEIMKDVPGAAAPII